MMREEACFDSERGDYRLISCLFLSKYFFPFLEKGILYNCMIFDKIRRYDSFKRFKVSVDVSSFGIGRAIGPYVYQNSIPFRPAKPDPRRFLQPVILI